MKLGTGRSTCNVGFDAKADALTVTQILDQLVKKDAGWRARYSTDGCTCGMINTSFGEPGSSTLAGWLTFGALFFLGMLRYASVLLTMEVTMNTETKHKARKSSTQKFPQAILNPVNSVVMFLSVLLETVWAFGVSWSAGAASPAPLAFS
jgi:hypothetical protein